ncbi:hypothetical protein [Polymorphum gilvum]|uniref:Uncharacterized protein n=1 Tax=Polymorphum gilvum (strain LMG 25793 / CGMCC 1.9160 / SL003B-26A1) TaxID=991905 RepID=F2J404_POLGS|nr:hypothetical protein [Polymorphum gilvum]ADZ68986.1 hypothetical protein SL003B_0553 [Polymorphum gilvum SL003B-26A1]
MATRDPVDIDTPAQDLLGATAVAERMAIARIRRILADLHMPCRCQDEIDRTMEALVAWESRRIRHHLLKDIRKSAGRLRAGIAFLDDLADLPDGEFDAQTCADHAETLTVLADSARLCAQALTRLAALDQGDDTPST